MRLSRLRTDTSPQPNYEGFRGRVRVGPIDPRGGSAEQLPAHQPIGVVRQAIQGAATHRRIRRDQGHAVGDESASRNRKFESTSLQQRVGRTSKARSAARSDQSPRPRRDGTHHGRILFLIDKICYRSASRERIAGAARRANFGCTGAKSSRAFSATQPSRWEWLFLPLFGPCRCEGSTARLGGLPTFAVEHISA